MEANVTIETITPEIAAQWLENRFEGQRKVRTPHVHRLASTIRNNQWRLTCDAVTLIKGKLGNGQHRCEAIVLAGKPCDALVLRTTDEKLFDIMDSGVARSVADVLSQHELGSATIVAAAARAAMSYEQGTMTRSNMSNAREFASDKKSAVITRQDVVQFCLDNQERLVRYSNLVLKLYAEQNLLSPSVAAAFLFIAAKKNQTRALAFVTTLYTGDNKDAAFDLRERLIKNKITKSKMKSSYIFGLLIKGFKAYLVNQRPQVYKIANNEEFPTL